jgi:hypothetical protein
MGVRPLSAVTFPARPIATPACPCPDHPGRVLQPLPGGGARGTCPADGRTYQMTPPEVKP